MTTDDMELVRQYAAHQSESAFAALVSRHTNLVYSAALRLARDPQLSEEITQAVFIILARKAGSLNEKTILPSWLYRAACYTSRSALKREYRRHQREQEAYMQSRLDEARPEAAWQQIAPLLEEGMLRLGQTDRDALVLRFFEGRSLSEVGTALGASEDAAKKRVNRALEKLRKFFFKRGVSCATAVVAGAISAHSVQAAPVALAKSVAVAALAKGAAASGSTLTLIKGALKIMAWTKAKAAAVAAVVIILAAGTTTVIVTKSGHYSEVKSPPAAATAESFRRESMKRLDQSKNWALYCTLFAEEHGHQLPKNFEQLRTYAPDLSDSNWEIVSGGNVNTLANPDRIILLREKESRQSPEGGFVKVYVFVDGHAEQTSSPDKDFAALEKQRGFLVRPATN